MSKIAVIGLGYVGLPLAVALAKAGHDVHGIDVSRRKLDALDKHRDPSGEVDGEVLKTCGLKTGGDFSVISDREFVIVAVPTPIDSSHNPDLAPLYNASRSIAPHLRSRCIVIYESTVYPGVTEDVCQPVLEAAGKVKGVDFRLGYSPERINPGDREHTIDKVIKVVSGQDEETLAEVARMYESIVLAGVHRAPSIKVAEAAKVIENTQRDINIALMNELAIIFDKMDINTQDVLAAAGTKWNFLKFVPGLVGGHCIGVDPYYLTYRARQLGYEAQVITAGRRINDGMGKFVVEKTIKMLIANDLLVRSAKVLILGLTFKENVPDFRNSRVADIVRELREYQMNVIAHDPYAEESHDLEEEFGLTSTALEKCREVDAVILAVSHRPYTKFSTEDLRKFFTKGARPIFVDIKGLYRHLQLEGQEFCYWQL